MFSFETTVTYSRTNKEGYVPLYEILNYFQDCTIFQSESVGMGIKRPETTQKTWILVSYKVKINRQLKMGDKIRVGTAPTAFKNLYGYRKFVIETLEGEALVEADSMWVMMDVVTRKLTKVSEEDKAAYVLEEAFNDVTAERKLILSEDRDRLPEFKVLKTDIDTNGHMNNANYLKAAANYLPDGLEYQMADILYNKEAVEGEVITPYIHMEEGMTELSFENEEGQIITKIRLQ